MLHHHKCTGVAHLECYSVLEDHYKVLISGGFLHDGFFLLQKMKRHKILSKRVMREFFIGAAK